MRKVATHPDLFLTKNKRLYFELIDQIIGAEFTQLPLTEEAARLNQVNINTIKTVYNSLAQQKYIETKRKSGSRIIKSFAPEQIDVYRNAKQKVITQLQSLDLVGFSANELIALLMVYEKIKLGNSALGILLQFMYLGQGSHFRKKQLRSSAARPFWDFLSVRSYVYSNFHLIQLKRVASACLPMSRSCSLVLQDAL